jgi:hypothetical protein
MEQASSVSFTSLYTDVQAVPIISAAKSIYLSFSSSRLFCSALKSCLTWRGALGQSMNEFRKAREEKAVRVEGKQGTLARKDWRIGTTFCAIFFDIFACSAKNSR